jgi:hypothetical protein
MVSRTVHSSTIVAGFSVLGGFHQVLGYQDADCQTLQAGECGTLLTGIFDSAKKAAQVSQALCTKTVDHSGWHVYSNMEHFNLYLKEKGLPFGRGAYPCTDDILRRSIDLSVGVVARGLGSAFGINIDSTKDEIRQTARGFREACAG